MPADSPSAAFPRLVISGLSGGGGKTLLSLGLARTLERAGIAVKPYKKGPDYIDAAWLGMAAAAPATNLDPFFLADERLRALFQHAFGPAAVAVIEGNRGLYDGRDVEGSCSTARLARALDAPVVLALNCTKMTRTAAAVVAGLAGFEAIRLAGVVLNQIGSARHGGLARRAIEEYTGIPVLGEIPRLRKNPLPERHMGLVSMHAEQLDSGADAVLNKLAALIREHCDVGRLLELARSAPAMRKEAPFWSAPTAGSAAPSRPRIGYVRDAALWFYYEENLEALRRSGANLVRLELMADDPWPHLDGLYLGGGFPEMLAAGISASPRLADIRALSERGCPIYAECGGFMLLCRSLRVGEKDYPMADLFPARAEFRVKPQGLGYVEAEVRGENPFHPVGTRLRGHEFHYSRCVPLGELAPTLSLNPGGGMDGTGMDGLLIRRTFAAYTHIFAPAAPHWAPRFVAACLARSVCVHHEKAGENIPRLKMTNPHGGVEPNRL